ncbi:hypothetical protein ARC20_03020 [Stenotrophomonas panacihumi]|uniref:Transmembrane protein n=1 Tax=Stenotrophomonas panacihumi TaxID=676599 RepID=A0A0R0AQA2_9GAMM|nr:DUF6164 family protein [Stenotrophomonas panacihumi]KRG47317.1 hypothetical protein ARC20_03020 [Stenotrophomonas panacihumi]PTN55795.1 hypothetical protein C9J98_04265 [Stenotrophomonas panacihumi]
MAKLLLNLRNVPDDEADEVRALLDEAKVDYYETRPSLWGISAGGIWLRDGAEHPRVKALLDAYQQRRGETARARRAAELADGSGETFGSLLRTRPLFVIVTLLGMVAVAALVLLPFLLLSR